MAMTDLYKREIGAVSTRSFSNRLAYSQDLVLRLKVSRKLEMLGTTTALSFNAGGDTLVTGNSHMEVIIWDWESGNAKLKFFSGHHKRINQAKFMPFAQDRSIVTCASDGQVRRGLIREGGGYAHSELLTEHRGKAHDLAIEPGSPNVLYTCGEDGMVHRIDLRRRRAAEMFNRSVKLDIPLTAIAIDPRNPNLFVIGGIDHPFARLYDVRKCSWNGSNKTDQVVNSFRPAHIRDRGIIGLAFSDESELLVSYDSESIYLFSKDMGTTPASATLSADSAGEGPALSPDSVAQGPIIFRGHANIGVGNGMKFLGPRCDYVMSGSICGRVFIWKKKSGELIRVLKPDSYEVHYIEAHPHTAEVASATERGVKVWTPTATEKAILPAYDYKDRNFAFGGLQPQTYAFLRRYGCLLPW